VDRQDAPSLTVESRLEAWCRRHYRTASLAILALAAVNLGYRLGSEIVTEWDEALYALTAWEVVNDDNWIATTFLGSIDYYNSKPPLNVWLIAVAFKIFGPGLIPLRLVSAVSAWSTIAVLQAWVRRSVGPAVALASSLILSTAFGFIYVHSGRSGNPDALFALIVLLTVVTSWSAQHRPWRRIWLGPLMAGAFLLKGPGLLLPLAVAFAVEWLSPRDGRSRWRHYAVAAALFAVPVIAWGVARWQADGWKFFDAMFRNDLVAITLSATDGHSGGLFYYLDVLQKNHYASLGLLVAALALCIRSRADLRLLVSRARAHRITTLVIAWAAVSILIPTVMATKLPWYLNSFYPAFAFATAAMFVYAWSVCERRALPGRRRALAAIAVVALIASEVQLLWYSHNMRNLETHVQGVILAERALVTGQRVFGEHWSNADLFVLRTVQAGAGVASGVDDFLSKSESGDYLVSAPGVQHPSLVPVRLNQRHALYQRR
jgi:4-amino-4-deoxy-L-arabinose transferase-like glycosyltransferase